MSNEVELDRRSTPYGVFVLTARQVSAPGTVYAIRNETYGFNYSPTLVLMQDYADQFGFESRCRDVQQSAIDVQIERLKRFATSVSEMGVRDIVRRRLHQLGRAEYCQRLVG